MVVVCSLKLALWLVRRTLWLEEIGLLKTEEISSAECVDVYFIVIPMEDEARLCLREWINIETKNTSIYRTVSSPLHPVNATHRATRGEEKIQVLPIISSLPTGETERAESWNTGLGLTTSYASYMKQKRESCFCLVRLNVQTPTEKWRLISFRSYALDWWTLCAPRILWRTFVGNRES